MQKRGQITIFILISLIVVIAFFVVSYIDGQDQEEKVLQNNDFSVSFQSYVESCVKSVGEQAVYDVALQGGYYIPAELSVPYYNAHMTYYWYNGTNLLPGKELIESELEIYLLDNVFDCFDGFTPFIDTGYSVNEIDPLGDSIQAKVNIRPHDVLFTFEYPISLKKGTLTAEYDKYQAAVPLEFEKAYSLASSIVDEQKKYPNEKPLSFISLLALENDFTFELIDYENDDVIYSLVFNDTIGKPLIYSFASKYDWSEYRYG